MKSKKKKERKKSIIQNMHVMKHSREMLFAQVIHANSRALSTRKVRKQLNIKQKEKIISLLLDIHLPNFNINLIVEF